MRTVLAIETATEACSVALVHGDSIVERHEIAPRLHAQKLLPMIDAVLAECGVSKRAIDAVAVGRGPGAFTGVRLAISAAQGIALGLDRPAVAVSTLAALAVQGEGEWIAASIDARMGEVYFGWFRRSDDGFVVALADETVGPAGHVSPIGEAFVAVGTGWGTYRDALVERLGTPRSMMEAALPHARDIALLALPKLKAGEVVVASHLEPVYLRDKVAQTLVEQGKVKPRHPATE